MIDDFAVSDQLWVRLLAVSRSANRLNTGCWWCILVMVLFVYLIFSTLWWCQFVLVFGMTTRDDTVAYGGDSFIYCVVTHNSVMVVIWLLHYRNVFFFLMQSLWWLCYCGDVLCHSYGVLLVALFKHPYKLLVRFSHLLTMRRLYICIYCAKAALYLPV